MNRTKIEWCVNPDGSKGFSWNPLGYSCSKGCNFCDAKGFAQRFGDRYCQQYPSKDQVQRYELDPAHSLCWNRWPHLHEERLVEPLRRKKPTTIFLGSTCDLWDPYIPVAWRQYIWGDCCKNLP